MFRQDLAAVWLDLAECHGLETTRALQPQREAANAGKQVEDAELFHHKRFPGNLGT
jgi:hypothetical protein